MVDTSSQQQLALVTATVIPQAHQDTVVFGDSTRIDQKGHLAEEQVGGRARDVAGSARVVMLTEGRRHIVFRDKPAVDVDDVAHIGADSPCSSS